MSGLWGHFREIFSWTLDADNNTVTDPLPKIQHLRLLLSPGVLLLHVELTYRLPCLLRPLHRNAFEAWITPPPSTGVVHVRTLLLERFNDESVLYIARIPETKDKDSAPRSLVLRTAYALRPRPSRRRRGCFGGRH